MLGTVTTRNTDSPPTPRNILVLGGTAWLSGEVARQAVAAGHHVTCLARGTRRRPPDGVTWLQGDRTEQSTLARAADRDWHLVIDVGRQPGEVRDAVAVLGPRAARWVFASTVSVYAEGTTDDESAALLPAAEDVEVTADQYGAGKVACEVEVCEAVGRRAVIARLGLIGGPGDHTQRSTHWPRRWQQAGDREPMLLPDVPDAPVQVLDVRDAAAWLLRSGLDPDCHGAYDVAGPLLRFDEWQQACREVTRTDPSIVVCDPDWLIAHEVEMWAGPRALPLWLPEADSWVMQRPCRRARAAGLVSRDPVDTVGDLLIGDPDQPLGTRAGLTRDDEAELLALWRSR